MKRFLEFVLRNRNVILLLYFCILVIGLYVLGKLPIDAIPDVGEKQQIIIVNWEGKDPKTIEQQITYPIVTKLFGIPNLKSIRSSSAYGYSMIYLIFEDSTDFYWARTRVIEKLQQVVTTIPEGVRVEIGPDATGLGQIFQYYIESSSLDLVELRTLQDWYIKFYLSSVDGVAEVASIGGFVKSYQVTLDPQKLAIYGIGINEVVDAIFNANYEVGAGEIEISGREIILRSEGFIRSKEDIENNVVLYRDGIPLLVKDIGIVEITTEPRRGVLIDKNGKEVVGGVVVARYGVNPREVIARVKKKIEEINAILPGDTRIIPYYDRTEIIEKVEHSLIKTLVEESLVVVVIIFIFLLHFRSSLIVIVSLPLSVLIAFIAMYILRIDGNIMSISGIAIAIGTLVDMSIITVENIHRRLLMSRNDHINQVVIDAVKEVGPAIITSVAMIVISFLPIFFLTGREGKLFHPLAYTKTLSIIGSLVVAVTLCPILATMFIESNVKIREYFVSNIIRNVYDKVIFFLFDRKLIIFGIAGVLIIVSMLMSFRIGREFMPQLDEGSILYMPSSTPSISITKAKEVMSLQNKMISSLPEVENVVGKIGRIDSATDPSPIEMFETIITLKDKSEWRKGITKDEIIRQLDEILNIPGFANIFTQPIINRIEMLSTGMRTQIGVKVFGSDINELQRIVNEIKDVLGGIKGVKDIYVEQLLGKPYIQIVPDRFKLANYGLSVRDFNRVIETAIGGKNITYSIEGRERYPIKIRFPREVIDSPEKIKNLFFSFNGKQVSLSSLCDIEVVDMPSMINSENGLLRIIIFFNVTGRDIVSFVEEARRKIDEKLKGKIPPGYFYEFDGEYKNQARASGTLFIVIPLSLLSIILIGYLNFRSLVSSLLLFTSIPVSISGGIILLFLSGYNFSVAVWTGFLSLFGIAANDAVVITTYITDRLKNVKITTLSDLRTVISDAGKARIRPALMIMITVLLSLSTIVIFPGVGKEILIPMAIPMIGGMITLPIAWFIIPLLYEVIYSRKFLNKTKVGR
ncbi:MAG: efflux RND transporter permease subunit [Brevinematia bacterium]